MACHFSPDAERCLDDIWLYVARESGSVGIADRVIDSLVDCFWLLGRHPRMGRLRADLRPDLRSFAVGEYVILYRLDGEDVVILLVLHGSRDLPALLE